MTSGFGLRKQISIADKFVFKKKILNKGQIPPEEIILVNSWFH